MAERVYIRAFSDAPIDMYNGKARMAFSLADGAYDMSRLAPGNGGIPLLFGHDDHMKIGDITGYHVARPDPDGEGTAAMMLSADLLPDEQLSDQARAIKKQVVAGTLTGASGNWDFLLDQMVPNRQRWGSMEAGDWTVKRWQFREQSMTNVPKAPGARVLSVQASMLGSARDGDLYAELRRRKEEVDMAEQNTAQAMTPEAMTAMIANAVASAMAAQSAGSAPEPTPDPTPDPAPAPETPVAANVTASNDNASMVSLQASVAALTAANSELEKKFAEAQKVNEEFRGKVNSLSIQPTTIEGAGSGPDDGRRYHFGFAASIMAPGGNVKETDDPYTALRAKRYAELVEGKDLLVPRADSNNQRLLCYATMDDMRGRFTAAVTDTTDIAPVRERLPTEGWPGYETFPYRDMLRLQTVTGVTHVPVVKTAMSASDVAESTAGGESSYAEMDQELRPVRNSVWVPSTEEAALLDPNIVNQIRISALAAMNDNDQRFIEKTWNANTAKQGVYAIIPAGGPAIKTIGGAAGAAMTRDKIIEMEENFRKTSKGRNDYFLLLNASVYSAMRKVKVDSGSAIFLIQGNANEGVTGDTMNLSGPASTIRCFASSFMAENGGVLFPGRQYQFVEWQGVAFLEDPFTDKEKGEVRYYWTSYRNGIALYPSQFSYIAES